MGRVAGFVLDSKTVDMEREKLLGVDDDSVFAEEDLRGNGKRRHSSRHFSSHQRGFLPSLKDAVKLFLFCAVTVVGMTFISQALPRFSRINKPQSMHDSHGNLPVSLDMCPSSFYNTSLSMDFTDPTKFAFTQISHNSPDQPDRRLDSVEIIGSIEVRSTEKPSGSYVHVDLDIRGSDPQLTSSDALAIAKTDASLTVKTPRRLASNVVTEGAIQVPCLYVSAIVTINAGAKLEKLNIDSESFAVIFRPGLDYAESRAVETKTHFESSSTYSRETIINVVSASVTGSFPLYDLLSIHTESGSITTDILPKNASRETVKPAVLRLSSNSGSIRNSVATTSVPDRDYQTSISTSSGSIDAEILHGLRSSLRSINGRITADLYPYGHNDSRTDIEVHCTSGSTDITLHSSISHPTAPLKKLYGYYRGVSGSLDLFYPAQWQGIVEGTTLSGSVDLNWQGLEIVKDGKEGYVRRRIEAVRGEGEGKLEFHETSGSMHLNGGRGGL